MSTPRAVVVMSAKDMAKNGKYFTLIEFTQITAEYDLWEWDYKVETVGLLAPRIKKLTISPLPVVGPEFGGRPEHE